MLAFYGWLCKHEEKGKKSLNVNTVKLFSKKNLSTSMYIIKRNFSDSLCIEKYILLYRTLFNKSVGIQFFGFEDLSLEPLVVTLSNIVRLSEKFLYFIIWVEIGMLYTVCENLEIYIRANSLICIAKKVLQHLWKNNWNPARVSFWGLN